MSPVTSDPTREPLFTKATYVAGATAALSLLAVPGVHVAPAIADAVPQLATLAAIATPFVTAWLARKHVTPVADPRDRDGAPLVPATPTEVADPAV